MIRNLISVNQGFLALPLAFLVAMAGGCRQEAEVADVNEQVRGSAAPQQALDTSESDRAQVDALVESYLDLRQLLAEDKFDGVAEALTTIAQTAQPLAESGEAQVKPHAETLAESAATTPEDIGSARKTFQELSEALIALVKVVPPSDAVAETLYVAYCPMAKASWLQATEKLSNPYMGQKMPQCGEVKETIPTS